VLRMKEDYDGAEPSGNSIAILNLMRLALMTNRTDFRQSAEKSLAAFAPRLSAGPVTLPQMLCAVEFQTAEPREILIAGERDAADTQTLLRTLWSHFVPNRIVLLIDSPEARRVLGQGIASVESMTPVNGRASAYVCRNYACQLPVSEAEKFAELLQ
jgi:uncharacterized protein